jgi:RNA polymerase sigma-70 factor (ECF subfamily)
MVSRSRFEELTIPHRNSAFNLAYWILQNREDAEDAVQDAYVRAFRAFDTFAGAGARAWLLTIVRNVSYSALDARKRPRSLIMLSEELSIGDSVDAVSQEPSPEAVVLAQEGQQLLLDALTGLSPIHRDILVLREMEGLSYAEISQITGTAIGTVMSRLSRARAELLRSVKGQLREPMDKIDTDSAQSR